MAADQLLQLVILLLIQEAVLVVQRSQIVQETLEGGELDSYYFGVGAPKSPLRT